MLDFFPWIAALLLLPADAFVGRQIDDFELPDLHGQAVRLSDFRNEQLVIVVFLGTKCPLASLYAARLNELADEYVARGVTFVAIDPNAGDSAQDLQRFGEQHQLRLPILRDPTAAIADHFGATRQLEVFVLDDCRRVRYHGRIDDQYSPGNRRAAATREDLKLAIDELLTDQQVTVPETTALGCLIQRHREPTAKPAITYQEHIAPILNRHCVECHREGQIGPFDLTTYADAANWSATIAERIADGTMPPWHADPRYGRFANERRLSRREQELISAWIAAETPEGRAIHAVPQTKFTDHWNIGKPDKIVTMPEPFQVPSTGVVENIAIELDPGFDTDVWIRGTEVHPGNRTVVHHCTVFIGPPGCKHLVDTGATGLLYFSDFVPGLMPTLLPAGMARRLPAGWHIYLSLHYVPNGVATTDQTSLGLVLATDVRQEVYTFNILRTDFELQPHQADQRVEQTWTVPADMLLLSLFPHMHVRGQSFQYEAIYPSGSSEILLSVPRYDFMWQHRYVLTEPKPLPAGTVLKAVATYDNSDHNPANPDPTATVRYGKLTTDEMFHGYFDAAFIPRRPFNPWPIVALLASLSTWAAFARRGR